MNGHETEVKFYVRDLKRVELRLRELKAQLIQPRVHEVNLRFDNPQGDLRKNMKVLRLRNDSQAKLTFKGPSEARASGVLSRREIEFTVGDFDSAREFLELLGFIPIVFYEKFRATYELEGVHIMLDELPYGEFVEIEGDDISALRKVVDLLGLNWEAMVKAGYHALFERVVDKHGLEAGKLSFKALENARITPDDLSIVPAD
ncbi:MAG: class IV adenylate cyclase [Chloroflexi bacterium]|nr:class IV adenylate cyclase [Chloroflexota bacterium]